MTNPFIHDEADIAERQIWNNANNKSQCSIASVVAINSDPISVNIQPLVNYFDRIGGWTPYPTLELIPVAQLQTSLYSIKTPLNIGDTGIVLWFDREIYTTLAGALTPSAPDSGDLSDTNACVFIPMLQPFATANSLQSTGVDLLSSNVSLLTQLLNIVSQQNTLLQDLTTFLNAIVASLSISTDPAYISGLVPASSALILSIATITEQITIINSKLTLFQGAQS